MPQTAENRTNEEISRLGHELFDRVVKPMLGPADAQNYVVIDVDSGDYESDANGLSAINRLLQRRPGAETWLTRGNGEPARLRDTR
jgi:hypothetical protein